MRPTIAAIVAIVAVGCGRIGFDARSGASGDGGGDDGGPPVVGFHQLVAYANQTCALRDGLAYCWGENTDGQLGDGITMDAKVPMEVQLPAGPIASLSQGEGHACAVVDGKLGCWGRGFTPMPAAFELPTSRAVTAVACGRDFTCAIAGKIFCWGNNEVGQLGDLSQTSRENPVEINSPSDTWIAVRAGDDHACALDAGGGEAQCWGHNDDGTMGTGSFSPDSVLSPGPVAGVDTLPLIAGWHACTLRNGNVVCWGRNEEGELGNGNMVPNAMAKAVPGIINATAIASGGGPTDFDASCAIVDGNVRCWGGGLNGRLGNGMTANSLVPDAVVGLPEKAVEVAIGYDHACAVVTSGDIYCWGAGEHGQLGDGNGTSSLVPVRVARP